MSNALYYAAKTRMLTQQFNWLAANLVVSAWTGLPKFLPTHTTIADIKDMGLEFQELGVALPVMWTGVSPSGIAQSDAMVFPALGAADSIRGKPFTFMTVAESNGSVHNDAKLILYVDEAKFLPFRTNGLDVTVTPDWLEGRGLFTP